MRGGLGGGDSGGGLIGSGGLGRASSADACWERSMTIVIRWLWL